VQPTREQRLEELRLEYAARFRDVCRDMSPEEFAKLVDEMARFRQKHEEKEAELARRPAAGGMPPKR
jgi:hypothetical protein